MFMVVVGNTGYCPSRFETPWKSRSRKISKLYHRIIQLGERVFFKSFTFDFLVHVVSSKEQGKRAVV